MIQLFLSDKAIRSTLPGVASRSCYNFANLVKKAQKEMLPHARQIIEGTVAILQDYDQQKFSSDILNYDDIRELQAVLSSFVSAKNLDLSLKEQVIELFFGQLDQKLTAALGNGNADQTENCMK